MGGIGQHRKCLLGLKIVWEGIGNRNFGPTWKCFLSDQEMGTGAVRVATTLLHGPPPPHRPESLCLAGGREGSFPPAPCFVPTRHSCTLLICDRTHVVDVTLYLDDGLVFPELRWFLGKWGPSKMVQWVKIPGAKPSLTI